MGYGLPFESPGHSFGHRLTHLTLTKDTVTS